MRVELPSVVELDYRNIHYKGWRFDLIEMDGYYLQISADCPDAVTGAPRTIVARYQCGRSPSDRFVFDSILELEAHEAAEHFTVDGDRPFYPH